MDERDRTAEEFRQAVSLCRDGRWREGYDRLAAVARALEKSVKMPGLFYSFLGAAMARCEGRKKEGLELCRYAVKLDPRQPDNYLNLASLYLMHGRRLPAVRALDRGLALSPRHEGLLALRTEIGIRRPPLIPFLSRDNVLNVLGGRLRHSLAGRWDLYRERRLEEREAEKDDEEPVIYV